MVYFVGVGKGTTESTVEKRAAGAKGTELRREPRGEFKKVRDRGANAYLVT